MKLRTPSLLAALALLAGAAVVLSSPRASPAPKPAFEDGAPTGPGLGVNPGGTRPPLPEPRPGEHRAVAALVGEALDVDGSPAAAAVIFALAHGGASRLQAEPEARPLQVQTDGGGRFTFADLAPGDYSLHARGARGGTGLLPLVRVPRAGTVTVRINIGPASSIDGRVLTEQGRPIAGAHVMVDAVAPLAEVLRQIRGGNPFRGREDAATRCDEEGRFVLAGLLPGAYEIVASAPGRVTRAVSGVVAPARQLLVELRPAASVRVLVTTGTGSPPDQLRVWTEPGSGETNWKVQGPETPLLLEGLRPGRYAVVATARGFTQARAEITATEGMEGGPLRFTILPGTSVRGRVLAADTKRPLGGARVVLAFVTRSQNGYHTSVEETLLSDSDGRWSARLRPGEWKADASLAGFTRPEGDGRDAGLFSVGEEASEQEIVLSPSAAIVGRVERADGTAVAGATVTVVSVEENENARGQDTVGLSSEDMESETDEEGRFQIDGASIRGKYGLEAQGPGGARAKKDDVVFAEGTSKVVVTLRLDGSAAPGRVEGRIVDESSHGVAGALVELGDQETSTQVDGSFAIDDVAPGTRRARYGGVGYALAFSPRFEVAPGNATRVLNWVLPHSGLAVVGRVTDSTGRPVEDAYVWTAFSLPDGGLLPVAARSDRGGLYRLEGPAMESAIVRLGVRADGFVVAERLVKADPLAHADVALESEAAVVGRIEFRGTTPKEIEVWYGSNASFLKRANVEWDSATGALRLVQMAPGRYRFHATAPGYAPGGFQDVEVREHETATASPFVLTQGGTLVGRVLDPRGRPLAGTQVSFVDLFLFADTDSEGRFRVEHAPQGRWVLSVNGLADREPSAYPRFEVTVEDGKTTETEYRVPPP